MSSKPDLLERHLRDLPYFRAILRAVEARMMQGVELPSPLLDVGCGDGHFASVTFDRGVTVGIDPERKSLREASRRGAYRLLVQARGDRLPFAVGSFASAFSNSVLEHVEGLPEVMAEISRVLQPGASLAITVPNPGYRSELHVPQLLRRIGLRRIGERYRAWFMRMSRTPNLLDEEGWGRLCRQFGLVIERSERYFSPAALHALEWGHYLGAPTLLPHLLTGRWILWRSRWNLLLTERLVRRYYEELPSREGTYTFFLVRKQL